MVFNRKVEVEFSDEDARRLDGQSKICNWLYNHLLEICSEQSAHFRPLIDDYKNNDGKKKLLSSRNLRNLIPSLKKEYPFLKAVYSSPLKNVAMRLKRAFKKFFSEDNIFILSLGNGREIGFLYSTMNLIKLQTATTTEITDFSWFR